LRTAFGIGEVVLAKVALHKVAKPREVVTENILVEAKIGSQRANFFRCTEWKQQLGWVARKKANNQSYSERHQKQDDDDLE
jgi:ABC-type sugar transport system ATPase subunit